MHAATATTAQALEALTDRAVFERLATSVLRKVDARYAAVIHTGINSSGETIVSPLDGLCLILGSDPPHYVFVQHTTTDRSGLRRKWLDDADSDLKKGLSHAETVRQSVPNAIVTVVLTTNQRTTVETVEAATTFAARNNLALDIWPQDRIADFLDTTADGQWLRREYLGMEAQRLSLDLLHHLCRKSLALLRSECYLQHAGTLVRRSVVDSVLAEMQPGGNACLLAGMSGYGKSIILLQVLLEDSQKGNLALWMPARFIVTGRPMETSIGAWLSELHPAIEPESGEACLRLAEGTGRVAIGIDDINRLPAPMQSLHSLMSVAVVAEASQEGGVPIRANQSMTLVIPIWPEHLQHIRERILTQKWLRIVNVGKLERNESVSIVQSGTADITAQEADEIAERLSDDPFALSALAVILQGDASHSEIPRICDDAIGYLIKNRVRELSQRDGAALLASDYESALPSIGSQMLVHTNIYPAWAEVCEWFGNHSLEALALRLLVQDGHLFCLDSDNRLVPRHDRILDRVLVDGATRLLSTGEPPPESLFDPYFARVVGIAISRDVQLSISLEVFQQRSPLVLFEAIRRSGHTQSERLIAIIDAAREWAERDSPNAVSSLLWAISWTLLESDSIAVLDIIQFLKPNGILMLAGLRNGSAHYGVECVRRSHSDFEPGVGNVLRDRIVEHARRKHEEELSGELTELAKQNLSPDQAAAILSLLGHLQLPGFDSVIAALWSQDRNGLLNYAIWAACRCPLANTEAAIQPLIEVLGALTTERDGHDMPPPRYWVTLYLGWSFARGITEQAVDALIDCGNNKHELQAEISSLLERVDHPAAIEFVARRLADISYSNKWGMIRGIGDNPPTREPWSSASANRLEEIWKSDCESDSLRATAFTLWLVISPQVSLAEVQSIPCASPFYSYAIQYRALIGDTTAVQGLVLQIKELGFWWMLAHHIWCHELRDLADSELKKLRGQIPTDFSSGMDTEYELGHLLVSIPANDAEWLLVNNWDHLRFSPMMIQAALRTGTPKCCELADASIKLCPSDINIFHLAFSHWGQRNRSNPITTQILRNYVPYFDRLGEDELLQLAFAADLIPDPDGSIAEWVRTNVIPLLEAAERQRVNVADEFILDNLDDAAGHASPGLWFIFDRAEDQFGFPDRQMRLVERWYGSNRSLAGLRIVAECIKIIGLRPHLTLLNKFEISGDPEIIANVKADAEFAVRHRTS